MSNEDEDANEFTRALQLNSGTILGMVMKAAILLDLFEIMAKAASVSGTSPFGDDAKNLSSDDIVAHLPTQNPAATAMLERILRFLAANSILIRTVVAGKDGEEKSLYSLASICKNYIVDEDGVSLAPLLVLFHDKVIIDSLYQLKDALFEGGIPFNRAHEGMHAFEYPAKDDRFNDVFLIKQWATLAKILAKYPQIRGINFDLPHVIRNAAPLSGVDHVGGSVPKGEWILHDWSDEHCLKLLNNCCNALPEFGKVVIVESVVPDFTNAGCSSKLSNVMDYDMAMLAINPGGKERSLKELEALVKQSGFAAIQLICNAAVYSVLEFHKKV
ncbi:hypothetical protein POM88_039533 [Heracleum sosnowskyi]|uniref:Caffeic acid O-methyltransferase n=1 Tax=Heracleum sosnowskyi TaxID=360622 RepID=A0AAD8HD97_9APIA|nr:hypothetical protein POM88_039533 [Heracleum sosnowskyi]